MPDSSSRLKDVLLMAIAIHFSLLWSFLWGPDISPLVYLVASVLLIASIFLTASVLVNEAIRRLDAYSGR